MFALIPYVYFFAREDFILSCFLAFHHSARSFLLLSRFRPRDVLQGIFVFLLLMHTYARGFTLRALWAKGGERGIFYEAQNECEARNEGRRKIKHRAPPLVSCFAQNDAFASLGS